MFCVWCVFHIVTPPRMTLARKISGWICLRWLHISRRSQSRIQGPLTTMWTSSSTRYVLGPILWFRSIMCLCLCIHPFYKLDTVVHSEMMKPTWCTLKQYHSQQPIVGSSLNEAKWKAFTSNRFWKWFPKLYFQDSLQCIVTWKVPIHYHLWISFGHLSPLGVF